MASNNTADWMANLPQHKRQLPLSQLAIPGTHDSGAFYLDLNGLVASDAPDFLEYVAWIPGVKRVTANWGITQGLDFKQQLEAGIRYFDLRVAVNPRDNKFYLVHTLYGPEMEDLLSTVNIFLTEHPGEVVLLDFNHFYNVTDADHQTLLTRLISVFGSKLCDVDYPVYKLTLEQMATDGKQIIVFYQCPCSSQEKQRVATRASILSPWPNTPDPTECLEYLEATFARPPAADFLVCQGVVTPTEVTVLTNLCGSLQKLNASLSPLLVPWVRHTTNQLNIVLADFVGEADFIQTVLNRNFSLMSLTSGAKTGQKFLW